MVQFRFLTPIGAKRAYEAENAQALFKARQSKITAEELNTLIARRTFASWWRWTYWWIGVLLAVGLVVAIARIPVPAPDDPLNLWDDAKGFALIASGSLGFIGLLYAAGDATGDDKDERFARVLRDAIAREIEAVAGLRRLYAEGDAFILFLRSFYAEEWAHTQKEVDSWQEGYWASVAMMKQNPDDRVWRDAKFMAWERGVKPNAPPEDILGPPPPTYANWNAQLNVLRGARAAATVISLGNLYLSDDKRADLASFAIPEVTIVREDWWQIFTEAASRARAIIVFLPGGHAPPSVQREIAHLRTIETPFFVVSDETDSSGNRPALSMNMYKGAELVRRGGENDLRDALKAAAAADQRS